MPNASKTPLIDTPKYNLVSLFIHIAFESVCQHGIVEMSQVKLQNQKVNLKRNLDLYDSRPTVCVTRAGAGTAKPSDWEKAEA
jgi:hypothetical protein